MLGYEEGGDVHSSGPIPDPALRGLEDALTQQYASQSASHETHEYFSRIHDELEAADSVLAGFEPLVHRKEFANFVTKSEGLSYWYEELIRTYGNDHAVIVHSQDWAVIMKEVAQFDAALAELPWAEMSVRDTEATLKAVLAMHGRADEFAVQSRGIRIEGEPNINRLILSGQISDARLKELYWLPPERSPRHSSGYSFLANLARDNVMSGEARSRVVSRAYYQKQPIDLIEPGVDPAVDLLRREVEPLTFENFELSAEPLGDTPEAIALHDSQMRHRIKKLLTEGVGLHDAAAERYIYALLERSLVRKVDDEESIPYISGKRIKDDLQQAQELSKQVSPAMLNYLSDAASLVNIDRYSVYTIRNLASLFLDEARAVEHRRRIQERGATVVFVSAYTDYNDSLSTAGVQYTEREDDASTILFEVTQPTDFYRRLLLLKKHGIKATTIVLAAHGNPGSTQFSDGAGFFNLLSGQLPEGTPERKDAHMEKVNFARITSDEFMADDIHGERRIIIESCSSAAGKDGKLSIAETIAKQANNARLKVIGATDSMGIYQDRGRNIHMIDMDQVEIDKLPADKARSLGVEFSLEKVVHAVARKDRIRRRLGLQVSPLPEEYTVRRRDIDSFEPNRRMKPQEGGD